MDDEAKNIEKVMRETLEEYLLASEKIGKTRNPKMSRWVSWIRDEIAAGCTVPAALAAFVLGYEYCREAEVFPNKRMASLKAGGKAFLFTWRMQKSNSTKPEIVAAALDDYRTRLAEKPRRKKTPLQVQVARDHGIGARTFQRYLSKNPLPRI